MTNEWWVWTLCTRGLVLNQQEIYRQLVSWRSLCIVLETSCWFNNLRFYHHNLLITPYFIAVGLTEEYFKISFIPCYTFSLIAISSFSSSRCHILYLIFKELTTLLNFCKMSSCFEKEKKERTRTISLYWLTKILFSNSCKGDSCMNYFNNHFTGMPLIRRWKCGGLFYGNQSQHYEFYNSWDAHDRAMSYTACHRWTVSLCWNR